MRNSNANDAILLHVFRRKGQFYVNPMAISDKHWRSLECVLAADEDGLLEALECAEQLARDLTKTQPRDKRFPKSAKEPDWAVAGVTSSKAFLVGTTCVEIRRGSDETEVTFFVPDKRGGLLPTTLRESLAPEIPLTKVAQVVADMFARADKTKPRLT